MRAFGGGGSRESACRRFRDAEGTRRGWNFGRCEPLVRQRDCLPTRVDASRLWPARRRRHRALVVRHRRPSLSFPRWETAPTVPRGGRFGRAPGSLMRRRLDAVSALASALCEALPRARLAELAGAPGRDVPESFGVVARSSFASRSVALARASEPPPRAHPPRGGSSARAPRLACTGPRAGRAAVPARARRVTIRAPRERGRPRPSRRARALVGDRGRGPRARETPPRRRARVLRVPRRGRRRHARVRRARRAGVGARLRARRLGRLGVGPRARRHERGPRGRRGHPPSARRRRRRRRRR